MLSAFAATLSAAGIPQDELDELLAWIPTGDRLDDEFNIPNWLNADGILYARTRNHRLSYNTITGEFHVERTSGLQ